MRILTVVGTRPEAIKLAPVILELERRGADARVCLTGQHREMLDQVLSVFEITPDLDLDVMEADQSLSALSARLMLGVTGVLESERPDVVVVQGDTTTVMISALAAFYLGISVAHVEAGLRSHDMLSPFPEEMNRRVVSVMAKYHFAPTPVAEAQLITEGVDPGSIWMTGNTVIDALNLIAGRPAPPVASSLIRAAGERRIVLVTAHRRENFGERMTQICSGIRQIVDSHEDVVVIYPVHLNPNVREPVERLLGDHERVMLVDPVDYETLVHLLQHCEIVLTDSGGIQEEAPSLGKPVLVLRTETERTEGIEAGTALLVGPSADRIAAEASRLLNDRSAYDAMAKALNPYGDGRAAVRIVDTLLRA